MPEEIVWRQPFPGPGLGIRVLGEITEEKLEMVRESDAILRDEIKKLALNEIFGNTLRFYPISKVLELLTKKERMIMQLEFVQ